MKKLVLALLATVLMPGVVSATETNENINYDDLPIVASNVTYVKTTMLNGIPVSEEVTEEEYNGYIDPLESGIAPINYVESAYKKLAIYGREIDGETYYVTSELTWKALPSTRSYDVFGIRTPSNAYVLANSQGGGQAYYNGSWQSVAYSYNGSNINIDSDGFGISMNLVDGATGYGMQIDCIVKATNDNNVSVYVSYQHAMQNVSLATSKNYSISASGMGGVFYFYNGVSNYYDTMPGTWLYIER